MSATPTVSGGCLYIFRIGTGILYAVNASTGDLIWSHLISDYDGMTGALSRTSPAINGNTLILGDHPRAAVAHAGANVIARVISHHRRAFVGRRRWKHTWPRSSPDRPAHNNVVYIGVSSVEESFADSADYALLHLSGQRGCAQCDDGEENPADLYRAGKPGEYGRLQRRRGLAASSDRYHPKAAAMSAPVTTIRCLHR